MPAWFAKLEGPALQALREMIDELTKKAMQQLKLTKNGLTIRQLRPQDLGLANPEWTFNLSTAGAFNNNMVNATIRDSRFVGIYGVMIEESAAQASTHVRITKAGQTKRLWTIQGGNFLQDAAMFFLDPIVVGQNENITIDIYATATDSNHRLIFLGVTIEKKGLVVA